MRIPGATRYRRPIFQTLLACADAMAVCAALGIAMAARGGIDHPAVTAMASQSSPSVVRLLLLAAIFVAVYAAMGLYRIRRAWECAFLAVCVMVASAVATCLFLASCYLAQDHSISRLVIGLVWLLGSAATWLIRFGAREAVHWCGRRGLGVKRIVVVGDDAVADTVCLLIEQNPHAGLSLVGRAVPHEAVPGSGASLARGTLDELTASLLSCNPHRVLFTANIADHEELQGLAERCLARNIEVLQVPNLFHVYPGQVVCRELMGMPLLGFGNHGLDGWELLVKDVLDRGVSAACVVILSPLLATLTLAVRWSVGGPPLRREIKAGRGGVPFILLSFETCSQRGGLRRATKLGAFLQATGLDRLPQLLNVLSGRLSLVGPQAETPEGLRRLNDWQRSRLSVKPGITGLGQINHRRPGGDPTAMVRDDLRYIETQSLLLDLKILAKTAWLVVARLSLPTVVLRSAPSGRRRGPLAQEAGVAARFGRSDGALR